MLCTSRKANELDLFSCKITRTKWIIRAQRKRFPIFKVPPRETFVLTILFRQVMLMLRKEPLGPPPLHCNGGEIQIGHSRQLEYFSRTAKAPFRSIHIRTTVRTCIWEEEEVQAKCSRAEKKIPELLKTSRNPIEGGEKLPESSEFGTEHSVLGFQVIAFLAAIIFFWVERQNKWLIPICRLRLFCVCVTQSIGTFVTLLIQR